MKIAFFSTKPYDERFFKLANQPYNYELIFIEARLKSQTAAAAEGCQAVCAFVNDILDKSVLLKLAQIGVKVIAMRCAGFNNVDLDAADELGLVVVRVPAYSPAAVAEHAVGLMMTLNRKFHRAYNRVREGNFALNGLVGFDMKGKTVGVIGTGKIGEAVVPILNGFGCKLVAYDVHQNPALDAFNVQYLSLDELFACADIITIHCPLLPATHHLINAKTIAQMKPGAMIINTSRGGIIDTPALIEGLKNGRVGSVGLDVYEEEDQLFFEDLSDTIIHDDVFSRLLTFPNVLVTGHQAFFTDNALHNIADTTLGNIAAIEQGKDCPNAIRRSQRG